MSGSFSPATRLLQGRKHDLVRAVLQRARGGTADLGVGRHQLQRCQCRLELAPRAVVEHHVVARFRQRGDTLARDDVDTLVALDLQHALAGRLDLARAAGLRGKRAQPDRPCPRARRARRPWRRCRRGRSRAPARRRAATPAAAAKATTSSNASDSTPTRDMRGAARIEASERAPDGEIGAVVRVDRGDTGRARHERVMGIRFD